MIPGLVKDVVIFQLKRDLIFVWAMSLMPNQFVVAMEWKKDLFYETRSNSESIKDLWY